MLSLDAHIVVDYFIAMSLFVLTIAMSAIPGARTMFLVCAAALAVYGLLSDMPLTARKLIPYPTHIALDAVVGALLIVGPWLFRYRADMNLAETSTHVGFGIALFVLMAITDRHSAITWPKVREDVLREEDVRPADLNELSHHR